MAAALASDLMTLLLGLLLYGGAARAAAAAFSAAAPHVGAFLAAFVACLVFVLVLIAEVGLLHRVLPKPRAGRHDMLKGAAFWGWILNFMLRRLLYLGPLRNIIYASNTLRYFSLRALGCNIAFSASLSSDVDILDPALTTIGPNATLGARVLLSSHYFDKGMLTLAPIVIEKGALLSIETVCAPGVTIGEGAQILGRVSLSVFATVGAGARVNHGCTIDSKAVVQPGEVLAPLTHRVRAVRAS